MPFYTITLTHGSYDNPGKILEAVRHGNAAAGYPPNDNFQRVVEYPASHLVIDRRYPDLPRDRSERLLTFEVLTSADTASDQKHRIRDEVVKSLGAIGVDSNDIIMFFVDYDRTTSTFGGGRPPAAIHLTK